jgi:hypothetical protein
VNSLDVNAHEILAYLRWPFPVVSMAYRGGIIAGRSMELDIELARDREGRQVGACPVAGSAVVVTSAGLDTCLSSLLPAMA